MTIRYSNYTRIYLAVIVVIFIVLPLYSPAVGQDNTLSNNNSELGKCTIFERVQHFFANDGSVLKLNSDSMSPTIKKGDEFGIDKIPFDKVRVGDVIAFYRPAGEIYIIVHRVSEIQNDSKGELVLTTKGDANPASIPGTDFPIREKNFIGKVYCVYSIF